MLHRFPQRKRIWHFCSPFVGIAMGIVTYLIVTAGLLAAGGSADKARGSVAVLVAAFIAAYNGDQFRALVRKTGDGLFGTPSTRSADPSRLQGPASGEAGTPKLTDTSPPPSEHAETPPPSGN